MDLYSPVILELNSSATNYVKDSDASHQVKAYNTFCGDKFVISFNQDGTLEDVTFHGYGCAVSKASTALMTEIIGGKALHEVTQICRKVLAYLEGENDEALAKKKREEWKEGKEKEKKQGRKKRSKEEKEEEEKNEKEVGGGEKKEEGG